MLTEILKPHAWVEYHGDTVRRGAIGQRVVTVHLGPRELHCSLDRGVVGLGGADVERMRELVHGRDDGRNTGRILGEVDCSCFVFLEDVRKVLDDVPVVSEQLILTEFEGFVGGDAINSLSVVECELHHVVRRVPSGDNITGDKTTLEFQSLTQSPPCWEGNCCRVDDGEGKLTKLQTSQAPGDTNAIQG